LDTNVILRYANDAAQEATHDIHTLFSEAVGPKKKRNLWCSSILLADLRPSIFVPGTFKTLDDFISNIRAAVTIISPDPNTLRMVARLRDVKWQREKPSEGEKPRQMTLGDAIHISTAIWLKNSQNVSDLEFMTFDNSSQKSIEVDGGHKSLPLLDAHEYAFGNSGNDDVKAVCLMPRLKPIISRQQSLPV